MSRSDIHRPSAIVPADYQHVLSYSLATSDGGWPVPSIGVNCELDYRAPNGTNGSHSADGKCCIIGMRSSGVKFAATGHTGKCSVCGANFVYGDVWEHVASGEHIHLGHDCADKYHLVADRTDWNATDMVMRAGVAVQVLRALKQEKRTAFLASHPGLEAALATKHNIVEDIAARFQSYGDLSDAQVKLVMRLADEASKPPEKTVAALEGKQTFRGTVVSVKSQESVYGVQIRMTVKMLTDAGMWLAWGTAPRALLDTPGFGRGAEVEVTCTLEKGRDAHFAMMKRPRGKVLKIAEAV